MVFEELLPVERGQYLPNSRSWWVELQNTDVVVRRGTPRLVGEGRHTRDRAKPGGSGHALALTWAETDAPDSPPDAVARSTRPCSVFCRSSRDRPPRALEGHQFKIRFRAEPNIWDQKINPSDRPRSRSRTGLSTESRRNGEQPS
jgi:hypothetical protein